VLVKTFHTNENADRLSWHQE